MSTLRAFLDYRQSLILDLDTYTQKTQRHPTSSCCSGFRNPECGNIHTGERSRGTQMTETESVQDPQAQPLIARLRFDVFDPSIHMWLTTEETKCPWRRLRTEVVARFHENAETESDGFGAPFHTRMLLLRTHGSEVTWTPLISLENRNLTYPTRSLVATRTES